MASPEKSVSLLTTAEMRNSNPVGPHDPLDYLIVALDLPTAAEALSLAEKLRGRCKWVKVGMELFYAAGGPLIRELQARGFRIFLDLKLHDIPNTVASTVRALDYLGVDLLTVHASGGPNMLRAAAAAAADLSRPPMLVGVTVLTSMDEIQLAAVGIGDSTASQVMRLATLSLECGFGALVASPLEVRGLRNVIGPEPVLIVPGIRPQGADAYDQVRTASARDAIADGASRLVIGRPITRAGDPLQAADRILKEISEGLANQRQPTSDTPRGDTQS